MPSLEGTPLGDLGFDSSLRREGFNPLRTENPDVSENYSIPDIGQLIPENSITPNKVGVYSFGQNSYDTGKGFWAGTDNGVAKLSIGDSSGNKLTWDGTTLNIVGGVDISSKLDKTGGAYSSASSGARVQIFPDANTGIVVYDNSANKVFQALVGGTDVGDVIMGEESTGQYAKWDKSTATFVVNGSPIANQDVYGDGSDGDVTLSGDTTITSDMLYRNLNVNGHNLNGNGYRVFVSGILSGTGKIFNEGGNGGNGGNGATVTAGTAGSAGAIAPGNTLPPGIIGKVGLVGGTGDTNGSGSTNGTNGIAGPNAVKAIGNSNGAQGGDGGGQDLGNTGRGIAGAAGAVSGTILNKIRNYLSAYFLSDSIGGWTNFTVTAGSGSGGSGAGGSGSRTLPSIDQSGGGGGSGGSGATGGIVWVSARNITFTGLFCSKGGIGGNGGNGGNGTVTTGGIPTSGHGGGGGAGGGGGNGGVIIIVTSSTTQTYTTDVTGGANGTPGTGGSSQQVSGGGTTIVNFPAGYGSNATDNARAGTDGVSIRLIV